jgi:hypothetical protein
MEGWIEKRLGETGGSFQSEGRSTSSPPEDVKARRGKISKVLEI